LAPSEIYLFFIYSRVLIKLAYPHLTWIIQHGPALHGPANHGCAAQLTLGPARPLSASLPAKVRCSPARPAHNITPDDSPHSRTRPTHSTFAPPRTSRPAELGPGTRTPPARHSHSPNSRASSSRFSAAPAPAQLRLVIAPSTRRTPSQVALSSPGLGPTRLGMARARPGQHSGLSTSFLVRGSARLQ